MLKKIIAILLISCAIHFNMNAQERATPNPEIRKLKIEFVTDKMSLTQAQSNEFIPLYERYSDELLYQSRAKKALDKKTGDPNVVNERQAIEEKIVSIKGKYKNEFLKIISTQQLAAMYKAESDFRTEVLEQWKQRQGK